MTEMTEASRKRKWSCMYTDHIPAAPLEKLVNLIEDIFEAEDTISMDAGSEKLSAKFFSKHSRDASRPALNCVVMTRLTKAIGKVSRPSKRMRLAAGMREGNSPSSPRKVGGISDIETQTLARILKILERSVDEGELIDPFGSSRSDGSGTSATAINSDKQDIEKEVQSTLADEKMINRNASRAPSDHNEANLSDLATDAAEDNATKLEPSLEIARDSIVAADCCIALLTSDRLAKQVSYSSIHRWSMCIKPTLAALLGGSDNIVPVCCAESAYEGHLSLR